MLKVLSDSVFEDRLLDERPASLDLYESNPLITCRPHNLSTHFVTVDVKRDIKVQ